MGLRTYKATGVAIGMLRKMLGIKLRVTGTENLVCRPTLFVANHFTRIETFLVPYVIFQYAGRQVRSLGTHSVFQGAIGRYFEAIGGMSTRHPRRNRTIVRELMTWRHDWVIYPEGGLIKNKKTIHRGRLQLEHPDRQGPPHTGAAMLALKAETSKRRYLEACEDDDRQRIEFYENAFGIAGPEGICPTGIVMVPVTLTFYPMRPSHNLINRLAKFFVRDLDPRIEEELTVEGSILLKGSEICIHFGEPIEVSAYLGKVVALARRVAGLFSEQRRTELFLRKQARRLTDACMQRIYSNLEVSIDHLLSYGLRVYEGDRIIADDLRAAIYLAAEQLSASDHVRVHPSLHNGITSLVTRVPYDPWASAIELATREGIIRREGNEFVINRAALHEDHDFHTIRLEKMMQVLANELEPIRPAVESVREHVNLDVAKLRKRTAQAIHDRESALFDRDYEESYHPDESKPRDLGEPYLLEARGATVGAVLAHGYLASPQQVRGLAEYLHGRGITVYAVRLPGHGTAPQQLTRVRWQDWLDSLLRGEALIRQHCDTVVVGGFSLGGALALLAAARRPETHDGVFSINAPMKLRDRRAPLVGPLVMWNSVMRRLGLSRGHYRISNEETESPDINYGVDYLWTIRELRRAARMCRRHLAQVTAPALIIQSDQDPLVHTDGGRDVLQRLGSQDKVLSTLPFDRHLIIRGEGSETVFAAIARFVKRLAEDGEQPEPVVEELPAKTEDAA